METVRSFISESNTNTELINFPAISYSIVYNGYAGINLEITDTLNSFEQIYKDKEKEWIKLVGKDNFYSIDKKFRDFLIITAGAIDFGFPVDIKKIYHYSIYDDST